MTKHPITAKLRWQELVACAPTGLFQTDNNGRYLYVNEAWCAISGVAAARALGAAWIAGVHPDDHATVAQHWERTRASGQPLELEYRLQRGGGAVTWVCGRVRALLDEAGSPCGYAGSITNIDSQKKAEQAASERETRFRDVANQAPVMIGVTDADGHITFLNNTWLAFRGKSLEEEEGWTWANDLHPDDRDRVCAEMEECINQNTPYSVEYRIKDKFGVYHWIYDTAIPRIDSYGQRLGYIGTAIVIDAQKQLEARLRAELAEKELLLREVHHRVKNNLQIISSLIYFQARKSEGSDRAFDELRQRLVAMSLIHDRLYQSNQLGSVNFGDYSQSLIAALESTFGHAGKTEYEVQAQPLTLALHEALPAGMILCELVTNSQKHAQQPGVVSQCRISVSQEQGRAVVEVADNGPGLPEGFNPHSDGHFGWALIRALVAQLGGDFEVSSSGGLRVRASFAPKPKAVEQGAAAVGLGAQVAADHETLRQPGPKVFLVEDEATIALQIRAWLREAGYVVCGHCASGTAALRQIPSLNPDVILMDIQLADGVSGTEVAERLPPYNKPAIIYLTAYDDAEMARSQASSDAAFITKPFQSEQLLECIRRVLRR